MSISDHRIDRCACEECNTITSTSKAPGSMDPEADERRRRGRWCLYARPIHGSNQSIVVFFFSFFLPNAKKSLLLLVELYRTVQVDSYAGICFRCNASHKSNKIKNK